MLFRDPKLQFESMLLRTDSMKKNNELAVETPF